MGVSAYAKALGWLSRNRKVSAAGTQGGSVQVAPGEPRRRAEATHKGYHEGHIRDFRLHPKNKGKASVEYKQRRDRSKCAFFKFFGRAMRYAGS